MTRFPVIALRSADVDTPDIERSERFYVDVWGLEVVERRPGRVYLRATGSDHHVLVLHAASAVALRSVTFRCAEARDLETIAGAARSHGCEIIHPAAPTDEPGGGTLMALREPQGGVLRFVHGDLVHGGGGPVADRPLRLTHVNINSVDPDAEAAFYESVLGFRLADRSKVMAFVRCNNDHHAVVITQAPVNGLNHLAFLVPDLESVMRASGRMVDHGYPIAWGVGRHGPGDNVFAYFVDPLGVVIEYTAEVLQVDDHYVVHGPDHWVWPPGRTDQWGIAPPKTDFVKAAQIAVPHAGPEETVR
jgi:catechol 2,3-dioxygenase-like lactoylglutathione lyase family enzyme